MQVRVRLASTCERHLYARSRRRKAITTTIAVLVLIFAVPSVVGFTVCDHKGTTKATILSGYYYWKRLDQRQPTRLYSDFDNNGYGGGNFTLKNDTTPNDPTAAANMNNLNINNELELYNRIIQLESIVAAQVVQMKRLREQGNDLKELTSSFSQVIEILRQAGLQQQQQQASDDNLARRMAAYQETRQTPTTSAKQQQQQSTKMIEAFDDADIFGRAPSSVIEAADAAGASILAALLAGKKRLLVDVRDAELNTNPETLVQFIELAVLPVAAGLEGLEQERNRLRIVFSTISQLLEYRKTMALAAPEVVALSTLGFDPVEQKDNLVVIVAPAPDDEEGNRKMNELLEDATPESHKRIDQPVVVLNHHMLPIAGPASTYEVAYHLRLLSVQYVSGEAIPEELEERLSDAQDGTNTSGDEHEAALEAAMKHASQTGANHGVTRAMVIRAYPKPWHVFVDLSPDTDADFEVAATFKNEPQQDDINQAIVECLEGSEQEDELVAQQMQEALESGQLDQIASRLGSMGFHYNDTDSDDEEGDADLFNMFDEDSV
jgi:hypothetical protein